MDPKTGRLTYTEGYDLAQSDHHNGLPRRYKRPRFWHAASPQQRGYTDGYDDAELGYHSSLGAHVHPADTEAEWEK